MKSCRSSRSPVRRFRERSIMCPRSPMWWPMARRSRPLSLSLIDWRVSRIWGNNKVLLKQDAVHSEWTHTEMFAWQLRCLHCTWSIYCHYNYCWFHVLMRPECHSHAWTNKAWRPHVQSGLLQVIRPTYFALISTPYVCSEHFNNKSSSPLQGLFSSHWSADKLQEALSLKRSRRSPSKRKTSDSSVNRKFFPTGRNNK